MVWKEHHFVFTNYHGQFYSRVGENTFKNTLCLTKGILRKPGNIASQYFATIRCILIYIHTQVLFKKMEKWKWNALETSWNCAPSFFRSGVTITNVFVWTCVVIHLFCGMCLPHVWFLAYVCSSLFPPKGGYRWYKGGLHKTEGKIFYPTTPLPLMRNIAGEQMINKLQGLTLDTSLCKHEGRCYVWKVDITPCEKTQHHCWFVCWCWKLLSHTHFFSFFPQAGVWKFR